MASYNYLKIDKRRFIQYNMWRNCKNNCEFCFNRGGITCNDLEKIKVLDFVTEKLLSEETNEYNEIGFIGGEFFDGQLTNQEVKNKFYNLFKICSDKYKQGLINKICIATNLIYDPTKELIPFIEYVKTLDILPIILFCTSYDTKYRFHSQQALDFWENNMKIIPELTKTKIHTEMIVTQHFINEMFEGKLNIKDFCNKYNTYVDFIEPTFIDYFKDMEETKKELPDFFPTRESFLNFVIKFCIQNRDIDINSFLSIKLRSDTSYYQMSNGEWIKLDDRWAKGIRRIDKTGEAKEILSYSDSNAKMFDDLETLRESLGN